MKMSASTKAMLRDLRRPLMLCGILCSFSLVLLLMSANVVRDLMKSHEDADKRMLAAARTTRELTQDLDSARKFLSDYDTLVRRSVIGEFEKQRSLDQIEHLMQAGWVEPSAYALAAQATLDAPQYSALNHHQVIRHSLSFEVRLPHELRLIDLLDGLTSEAVAGLTTVESCEISRGNSEQGGGQKDGASPDRPLSGRCTLNWYRFGLKSGPGTTSVNGLPGSPGSGQPGLPPLSGTKPASWSPGNGARP